MARQSRNLHLSFRAVHILYLATLLLHFLVVHFWSSVIFLFFVMGFASLQKRAKGHVPHFGTEPGAFGVECFALIFCVFQARKTLQTRYTFLLQFWNGPVNRCEQDWRTLCIHWAKCRASCKQHGTRKTTAAAIVAVIILALTITMVVLRFYSSHSDMGYVFLTSVQSGAKQNHTWS